MHHQLRDARLEPIEQRDQSFREIAPSGEGESTEVLGVARRDAVPCCQPVRRVEQHLPHGRERPPRD